MKPDRDWENSLIAGALLAVLILVVFIAVSALSGCATAPLVTEIQVEKVKVPVESKCIDEADIPPLPKTHMVRGGTLEQNAAGASADLRELVPYAVEADALLRRCAVSTAKEVQK